MIKRHTSYTLKNHLLTIKNGHMYGLAKKGIRHIIGAKASRNTYKIRFINVTAPLVLDNLFIGMTHLKSIDLSGLTFKRITSAKRMFSNNKLQQIKLNSTFKCKNKLPHRFAKWYPVNKFSASAVKLDNGKSHAGTWQIKPKAYRTTLKFINKSRKVLKSVTAKRMPETRTINVVKQVNPKWHLSLIKRAPISIKNDGKTHRFIVKSDLSQHKWGSAKCDFHQSSKSLIIKHGQITEEQPAFLKDVHNISFIQAVAPKNMTGLFSKLPNLTTFNGTGLNTANVTSMRNLFKNDHQLTNVNLLGWDGINLTDARDMFANDTHLFSINLKSLDTLSAKRHHHLTNMFANTKRLHYLELDHNTCLDNTVGLPKHWYMTQYVQPTTNLMDGKSHIGTWRLTPSKIKTPLYFVDGVNFVGLSNVSSVENTIVSVGKHPVGLPTGYHVFDPDEKIVLSGHSQNIQIVKNKPASNAASPDNAEPVSDSLAKSAVDSMNSISESSVHATAEATHMHSMMDLSVGSQHRSSANMKSSVSNSSVSASSLESTSIINSAKSIASSSSSTSNESAKSVKSSNTSESSISDNTMFTL